jgi:hypothetical protein
MHDADNAAIGGVKFVAADALLLPDGLEEAFGRRGGGAVAQRGGTRLLAESGVEPRPHGGEFPQPTTARNVILQNRGVTTRR